MNLLFVVWDAAPHLAGLSLKLFVKLVEAPLIGPSIMSYLKKQNKMFRV